MTITNPAQLIDEFKKSGEFDRLRRELLSHFQRSDRAEALKSRVDHIARQRLSSDPKLISMPNDAIQRELLGEIDRYPIVERAVADAPLLSDPAFVAGVRTSLQRALRGEKNHGTPIGQLTPPNPPTTSDLANPDCKPHLAHTSSTLPPSLSQKD